MRALAVVAFLAAALHLVAAVGTVFLILPGAHTEPDEADRERYVRENGEAWAWGWFLWALAASSLIVVYAMLARPAWWGLAGMAFAAAGLAVDMHAHTDLAFSLPQATGEARSTLEDHVFLRSALVANGLYTLAGAFLVVGAARVGDIPRKLAWGALPAGIGGAGLALAVVVDVGPLVSASGALMIVGATAWLAALGWWAWRAS